MSVSLHVVGFRPADEKWSQMKQIWNACRSANVPVPDEVENFFDGEAPGDKPGAEVDIKKAVEEWRDDYRQGYEIHLGKLPKGVHILRAYLS